MSWPWGSRLYRFDECVNGDHESCLGETRNDTCTCGCHAEIDYDEDDWRQP